MKLLRSFLLVLFILYAIACFGLYFAQDHIIFDPHTLPESHQFRTGDEIEIQVADDLTLNTWVRDAKNAEGVILYFHGNRGNNRRCIRQVQSFAPDNYKVYMPDYRGYGKSEGVITSERQMLSDAQKVYNYVREANPDKEIVLVGFSLGSGIASYIASENEVAQLILIAPYKSFIDLKNRYFPVVPNFLIKYPLRNNKYLRHVDCPVFIHHGTEDEVIPFESSVQLEKINPTKIRLIPLEGTGHRGAIFSRSIPQTL